MATCEAHKYKCEPVICPTFVAYLDLTPAENIAFYFINETSPADGTCLKGEKFIYNGTNYADELAGKFRCICVDNQTPAFPVSIPCPRQTSSTSSSHEKISFTQCKDPIQMEEKETWGAFFKRVGARGHEFDEECCCPEHLIKYVLTPDLSGYRKNIFNCVNPENYYKN
jgi:hypothetical protein